MLPEDDLKRLRDLHGEIAVIETRAGTCVFRPCTRAEYGNYCSRLATATAGASAADELVQATVVFPSRPEFEAMCERYPFIASVCFVAVSELSGAAASSVDAYRTRIRGDLNFAGSCFQELFRPAFAPGADEMADNMASAAAFELATAVNILIRVHTKK